MTQVSESSPLLPSHLPAAERYSPAYDSDETKKPGRHDSCPHSKAATVHNDAEAMTTTTTTTTTTVDSDDVLRDVIIGFSDGLTVPFALTAGLSGLGSSRLVVAGGLAELFSGMISMGLGAYLAASTERDRQDSAAAATQRRLRLDQEDDGNSVDNDDDDDDVVDDDDNDKVYNLLRKIYSVPAPIARPLVDALEACPAQRARFLADVDLSALPNRRLRHHRSPNTTSHITTTTTTTTTNPNRSHNSNTTAAAAAGPKRYTACLSGLAMGLSYLVGGLVPMLPYLVVPDVGRALVLSTGLAAVALLLFGYAKSHYAAAAGDNRHRAGLRGAVQTLAVGAVAAGASFVIVKALDS